MTVSRRHALAAMLSAVVLSGCVTPAFNAGAFTENAKGAVESTLAETQTAALVVEQSLAGTITGPLADVSLTNCEDAIGPIADSFGKVQPPTPTQDSLRTEVLTLIDDAESAIADARIAARRDDRVGLAAALSDLDATASDLEQLQQELG